MIKGFALFAACLIAVLSIASVAIADWESPDPRESHTAVLNAAAGTAVWNSYESPESSGL